MRSLVLLGMLIAHPIRALGARRQERGQHHQNGKPKKSSWFHFARVSWYGREFAGRRMANGEFFDPRRMTAASRTYPLGTRLELYALRTHRSVVVTITDRGPFSHKADLDISAGAATILGVRSAGIATVRVRKLA